MTIASNDTPSTTPLNITGLSTTTPPAAWLTGSGGRGILLTEREAEVLLAIARGLSNQEVADALFLSINSVKTYIRSAYRKIGATTRSQGIIWAYRNGLED